MQSRINMITLGTRNLELATRFYEHGLRFPKMTFEGDISFFKTSGSWIALYPWDLLAEDATVSHVGSGFRGVTLAHTVTSENEVIAVLSEAKNAGASIVKVAQKTTWGGFSGYFADLDDHLWEVAFNPFFWPGPAIT
jgi:catechol 2,3-dioxygenase-like lactoylglutathione lyase family enzyme